MSDFTMGATLTLTDNFSSTLTAAGHNAEAFKSQITGISSAMSSSQLLWQKQQAPRTG